MTTALATQTRTIPPSSGGRLVATDGRELPLRGTRLTADARGGLARVVLEQRFANRHAEPLAVTYLFPLPHDGAVSGYAFRLRDRRIVGEVDRLAAARRRFEEAVLEGRSAALLEQERGSLFTQSVGNVPPGEEVVVELQIDQRLAWVNGGWEWRFPSALAPRYLGAEGRVDDAERVAVDVAEGDIAPRLAVSLLVRDAVSSGCLPESPSHDVRLSPGKGGLRVTLGAEEGVPLDRDVVVRWPVAAAEVGLSIDTCSPRIGRLDGRRAFGLLTVVPPGAGSATEALARDLIVLLDTSGSMGGRPLEQAKAIVAELVRSLGEGDSLELVSFSDEPRRWRATSASIDPAVKADALRWLGALSASGGTEMRDGVLEALRPLRDDAQRQVVLVTDGLIGSEQEVIATVLRTLPAGSRLHAVAVGDAVNRSLTSPVARAGRGLEVVVGLEESPLVAASALVIRTARPLVTGLSVEGSALAGGPPAPLADLFGGAPALVPVELHPSGGEVVVRGATASGLFERRIPVAPVEVGAGSPAAAALFAREAVEALEMRLAAGEAKAAIDARIEGLGLDFQISTRLTAWVAVSEEPTVDPSKPFRRERMPQAVPHGMSVEGLGLRACAQRMPATMAMRSMPPRLFDQESPAQPHFDSPILHGRLRAPPPSRSVPPGSGTKAAAGIQGRAAPALAASYAWLRGRLVVTVSVESGDLEWEAPAEATLTDVEGRTISCRVDAKRTTSAGTIRTGRSFRVVVDWAGPERADLASLVVQVGGRDLAIPLSEA